MELLCHCDFSLKHDVIFPIHTYGTYLSRLSFYANTTAQILNKFTWLHLWRHIYTRFLCNLLVFTANPVCPLAFIKLHIYPGIFEAVVLLLRMKTGEIAAKSIKRPGPIRGSHKVFMHSGSIREKVTTLTLPPFTLWPLALS